jgi:hypothetical protein
MLLIKYMRKYRNLPLHRKVKEFSPLHTTNICIVYIQINILLHASPIHRFDDGGNKHLRNVGKLLPDYTVQLPRRRYFSVVDYFKVLSWHSFERLTKPMKDLSG